ncbi:MAG: Bacteriophage tail assembly protein-like protein [Verrucomicrobiales bacterium]|nr:Bacteriophage tail assembly protein-like protein [Verrucomicrobiales bacterium]
MAETTKQFSCETHLRGCFAPPSNLPSWRWMEIHIELDNTSAIPGRYSTEMIRMIRTFCELIKSPYTRRMILMVSAQSGKTQTVLNQVLHDIAEDPGPAMWVMASADNCTEFVKKRLLPAVESCVATKDLVPKERSRRNKKLIQFDTMNLIFRGSNSRVGLQSDPVRRIYCDERREWKRGAIDLLRKRTRTFHNAIEISMGTAGLEGDELHVDFMEGSQTFCHWNCLRCKHSQPFRFGRTATVLFKNPRERGGVVWETNELTRPGGKWVEEKGFKTYVGGEWDFEELKKTVRYECENCGHRYQNSEKMDLLESYHPVDYNPKAPRELKSMHWNALYMPWPSCDWAEFAVEFLKAIAAAKFGNLEPLIAFVTESLGEPFEENAFFSGQKTVVRSDYELAFKSVKKGEFWPLEVTRIMGIDVQLDHFWFVVRAFAQDGTSRYVAGGKLLTWDHVREKQLELGVEDQHTVVDFGYNMKDAAVQCCQYGWRGLRGSEDKAFPHYDRRIKVLRNYSRPVSYDPSIGERNVVRKFRYAVWALWSNPSVKDFLHLLQTGQGIYYGIPSDVSPVYIEHMDDERRKRQKDGTTKWEHNKGCHSRDCECMILTIAMMKGLLSGTAPAPPKKEEQEKEEADQAQAA